MKKGKWVKVLRMVRIYTIYVFAWFGGTTMLDYFFFEDIINNEVIASNLWLSPFMALVSLIINNIQIDDERESDAAQLFGEKE